MTAARLWHGGIPGLRQGDLLAGGHQRRLHPGCPECDARATGGGGIIEPVTGHPDRIYVTTDREYARFYASLYGYGDLYQVEAVDHLVPSDEDLFPTWSTRSARVTAVYARAVRLTWPQRRALLRRWPDHTRPENPANPENPAKLRTPTGLEKEAAR